MEGGERARLEEDFKASLEALEMYRMQLDGMYQQLEVLRLTIAEHSRAAETVREYAERAEGDEMLVPIGASSFIFAKVASPKRAIVGIGSGVRVESDSEDGIARLEKKLAELRGSEEQLAVRIQEAETYAAALQEKLNRMAGSAEGQ